MTCELRRLRWSQPSAEPVEGGDRPVLADRREVGATGLERGEGRLQRRVQLGHLAAQLRVAGSQGGYLVLELEDPAYSLEAYARGGQLGDLPQQLDVTQ